MQDLIKEYNYSLRQIVKLQEKTIDEHEKEILSGMASDLRYALDWLRSGRRPGNRRGIERRGVYKNTIIVDPVKLDLIVEEKQLTESISIEDKNKIDEALSVLTKREKEVYLLVHGQGYSREEAASSLGVVKGTVNNLLKRCDEKIKIKKSTSLFFAPLAN